MMTPTITTLAIGADDRPATQLRVRNITFPATIVVEARSSAWHTVRDGKAGIAVRDGADITFYPLLRGDQADVEPLLLVLDAVNTAIAALATLSLRTIPIDQPALEAAYERARKATPDTSKGWGKALVSAYEWLMQVWLDEGTLTLNAEGALLVDSAREPGRQYWANGACQCQSYDDGIAFKGKPGVCWHRAAARLVRRMEEEAACDRAARDAADCDDRGAVGEEPTALDLLALARQLPPQPAPLPPTATMPERISRAREALALVNELF